MYWPWWWWSCYQDKRCRGKFERGGAQAAKVYGQGGNRDKPYVVPSYPNAKCSYYLITWTIFIFDHIASILFDPESTFF